jgi:hypothetical protein
MRYRQPASLTEPNEAVLDDSEGKQSKHKRKPSFLCSIPEDLIVPAFQPSRRRHTSILGTPTFSKPVHFDPRRKLVRDFLQVERPLAVAAGSYPVESDNSETKCSFSNDECFNHSQPPLQEWGIITANFPAETYERLHLPVRVQGDIIP